MIFVDKLDLLYRFAVCRLIVFVHAVKEPLHRSIEFVERRGSHQHLFLHDKDHFLDIPQPEPSQVLDGIVDEQVCLVHDKGTRKYGHQNQKCGDQYIDHQELHRLLVEGVHDKGE